MRYTLMQLSDIHTGAPFQEDVARAVMQRAHALRPDLLVVAGDLVQRAVFPWEWRAIRDFLHALPQPQLVVPGNHDVPLLDGFSRVFAPTSYYRQFFSAQLNPVFTRPGLLVVGANSAHGLTVDSGRVNAQQRQVLEEALSNHSDDAFKVVVMHHPIISPPIALRSNQISNAREVIALLERCNVDMYLNGHMHFSYVAPLRPTENGVIHSATQRNLIVSQSGTAVSNRGRRPDHRQNSFNWIEVSAETVQITQHYYRAEEQQFVATKTQTFPRYRPVSVGETGEE